MLMQFRVQACITPNADGHLHMFCTNHRKLNSRVVE